MSAGVILSNSYLEELEREFRGLRIPRYKFRGFFEEETRVFFDCEGGDPVACLEHVLGRSDLRDFVVLLLTKERESGNLGVLDVSYRPLGTETLRHFMSRYQTQLEPAVKMSLMMGGLEYQRLIGFSYEERKGIEVVSRG